MLSRMRLPLVASGVLVVAALTACSPTASSPGSSASNTAAAGSCATGSLATKTAGKLVIATDSPAYDPWFSNDDPTNGKGYESAVAYAVAKKMGFAANQVTWVKEGFNSSYAPGRKPFDFDINEISITPDRAKVVDFSHGYYSTNQAIVTLTSQASKASSLAGLKSLKLGAQTGTTSLTALRNDVAPTQQPLIFGTSDIAVRTLLNKQVDGIVVDLPTAFYLASSQSGLSVAGQFVPSGAQEQFGLLLQKGSALTTCVNGAIDALKADGTLASLQNTWLSTTVKVPVLK